MELIERYLQAVKFWLPKAQKQDIIAELSEDIHSQVEEKEAELGRKLNEAEVEAILRQRGRPVLVANRYQPQQFLIGQVLFPIYVFVLKIVALCYLAPWILVWIGLMSFSAGYRAAHANFWMAAGSAWSSFWASSAFLVGAVTMVFAVLEQAQARSHFLEKWDPRKLPPLRDPNQIKRFNSVMEIVALGVFGVGWWVTYLSSLRILDLPAVRITLTPAWWYFFWSFLAVNLANLTLSAVNLARPYWTVRRAALRLLIDAAGSALFCWLLKANLLAEISLRGISAERAAAIAGAINAWMSRSLPIAVLLGLAIAFGNIYRVVRVRRSLNTRPLGSMAAAVF